LESQKEDDDIKSFFELVHDDPYRQRLMALGTPLERGLRSPIGLVAPRLVGG